MIQDPQTSNLELVLNTKEFNLFRAGSAQIDDCWGFLKFLLEKDPSLWNHLYTIEAIYEALTSGRFQVWFVSDGPQIFMTFITQIEQFPVTNVLSVVWGTGSKMQEWLPLVLNGLEQEAVRFKLGYITIDGRLGWKAPLAKFGYTHIQSKFMKPVYEGRRH